ncbi:MAG: hypothetical protein WCS31_06145 [Verrucomicrobiae bacterium]
MTLRITIEIEIEEPAPSPRPLSPGAEKLREFIREIYSEPCPWHLPARAE